MLDLIEKDYNVLANQDSETRKALQNCSALGQDGQAFIHHTQYSMLQIGHPRKVFNLYSVALCLRSTP